MRNSLALSLSVASDVEGARRTTSSGGFASSKLHLCHRPQQVPISCFHNPDFTAGDLANICGARLEFRSLLARNLQLQTLKSLTSLILSTPANFSTTPPL